MESAVSDEGYLRVYGKYFSDSCGLIIITNKANRSPEITAELQNIFADILVKINQRELVEKIDEILNYLPLDLCIQ